MRMDFYGPSVWRGRIQLLYLATLVERAFTLGFLASRDNTDNLAAFTHSNLIINTLCV